MPQDYPHDITELQGAARPAQDFGPNILFGKALMSNIPGQASRQLMRGRAIGRVALVACLVGIAALAASTELTPQQAVSRLVSTNSSERIDLAPDLYLQRVGDGAYIISHTFPWLCNSVLVEMADGSLVMGGTPCTPKATELVLAWSKKRFGERKLIAINTGYHVDNLGGNQALLDAGFPVYGSDLTVTLLKERGEQTRQTTLKLVGTTSSPAHAVYASMRFAPPDRVFPIQDGLTLKFGSEEVRVFYPGPSQAPDKVVVYFPDRRLLFGSCMILAGDRLGNTAEADMGQWPVAIRRLEKFAVNVVVPGHGKRLDPGLIQHTLDLLERK